MWDFKISYIGSAIAIFFIAFSLFIEWIYMANVRYKYQKIQTYSKNKSIKNAKNILNEKNINAHFKRGTNFFNRDINVPKKIIRFEDRLFFKNSIYDIVNSVFLAYKYSQFFNNNKLNFSFIIKIFIAVFALNFVWTIFFGLWILVLIFGLFYIFLSFVFIFININIDFKSAKFSLEYLKNITNENEYIFVKKYIKYKKIESIILIFKLFTAPIIDLIKIIKIWGQDD